jgi:hypothetical protein
MKKIVCTLSLLISALVVTAAQAGTIGIQEPGEGSSDPWTVTIAGLPPGNGSNGTFQVLQGAETVSFAYESNRVALGNGTITAVLFEDAAMTLVSDILTVTTQDGSSIISVSVTSDNEQALALPAPPYSMVVEDGTMQQLITFPFADGSTDTISLQSDVESPTAPAPATFLGGGALLGVLGVRRLARRASPRA